MTDALGDDLVDGNAEVNVGAGGFAGAFTGEEGGVRARVIARAVVAGIGIVMVETAQHLDGALQRRERLHGGAEREVRAFTFRPPILLMRAVGKINERGAHGCAGGGSGEFSAVAFGG